MPEVSLPQSFSASILNLFPSCQPFLQSGKACARNLDVVHGGLVGLLREAVQNVDRAFESHVQHPVPEVLILVSQLRNSWKDSTHGAKIQWPLSALNAIQISSQLRPDVLGK